MEGFHKASADLFIHMDNGMQRGRWIIEISEFLTEIEKRGKKIKTSRERHTMHVPVYLSHEHEMQAGEGAAQD